MHGEIFFFGVLQIYSVISQTQATCKRFSCCKFRLRVQAIIRPLFMFDGYALEISNDNLDITYPLLVYQVTNVHFFSVISHTQ